MTGKIPERFQIHETGKGGIVFLVWDAEKYQAFFEMLLRELGMPKEGNVGHIKEEPECSFYIWDSAPAHIMEWCAEREPQQAQMDLAEGPGNTVVAASRD